MTLTTVFCALRVTRITCGRISTSTWLRRALGGATVAVGLLLLPTGSVAAPTHGIAMLGEPALAPGFMHLPYANPNAPAGGKIVYGEIGTFDSLHPYIVKGRAPWGVRAHVFESLMGRSWDEPFTLYGLLAAAVETPEDRSWVEFVLRPEARFSDGSPVTVDDVEFSLTTLREQGRPNHRRYYGRVQDIVRTGPQSVRFEFTEPDRELPLLIGLMPILQQADWAGRDFAETTLSPPVGTGPYVVGDFETGRWISFVRNEDYWGNELAFNRGLHNFDEIRYEYFRDENARFEAFKAGEVRQFRENDPVRWAEGYEFPAVRDGRIRRGEIPHGRPSGMLGLVMNTRRGRFEDRRVRQALEAVFDFEWVNETLFRGAYRRTGSYFDNSELAHRDPPTDRERELLTPHLGDLPSGILDAAWSPTTGDGSGRDRQRLRRAKRLLAAAGWNVQDGRLRDAAGADFSFEILLGGSTHERVAEVFAQSLQPLGIEVNVRTVDSTQYLARLKEYDYDAIVHSWYLSLSPGAEQGFYWGSDGVTTPGTRNYMGVDSAAIDATVEALTMAATREEFVGAVRALDRLLSAGVYVVPFWYSPADRFAWWANLSKPETPALYGYRPEVWWSEEAGQ